MKVDDKDRLKTILQIDQELNRIQDLDLLLEQILDNARSVVDAEAGSIYTVSGEQLHFRYTQNEVQQKALPPGEKLVYNMFYLDIDDTTISGYVAKNKSILNIPNMYKIPKSKPYTFNDRYDKLSNYKTISSLTFPLVSNQDSVLGVLQLINKKDDNDGIIPFTEEDETIATHFASIATVALQRARMTRTLILRMIRAARLRDPKETGAHVNRVGGFASELYEAYAKLKNLPQQEIIRNRDTIRIAAMLHDVGKVAISDQILKKPARLTEDEYKIMQMHTVKSAELLGDTESELEVAALEVAIHHHENWDGTGYPGKFDYESGELILNKDGSIQPIAGEDIPLFARIVSIADVYDALCSKRVYKEAWDESNALSEMKSLGGKKFDPELINLFLSIIPNIKNVQNKYPDENHS